jgi:hypothetical protein
MTAAQKKNVERFKKAAAEAKKLRKKNPSLTQAQAVKQAFAILYKTGKVSGTKKPATKKKVAKKSSAKSYHKDTKSHNVRISVVSGIGAAGDYAKFEIATIKALAKILKKSIKDTQILVNNDQTILNIISNSFDQKLTPTQTAKIIKAELMPAPKKDPLNAFVKLLSKPSGKSKSNFPMKLPATVTIGSVSGVGKERMLRTWTDVYGRLSSEYIRADQKGKKIISKEMKIAKEIIQKLKRSK